MSAIVRTLMNFAKTVAAMQSTSRLGDSSDSSGELSSAAGLPTLYLYQMPLSKFSLRDACAGYWTCDENVAPEGVERVDDLERALEKAGASLRILPNLWQLHDAAASSTLSFSMIRMRNAAPAPV
ncbi:DUF6886 family protein [Devosia pacifica]|uniref:DUF6886 family protein n=1 Tax=Devosia pacifica TaxID=1335967 RepID=UPI00167B5F72|nr:DUF6886 family protein [Devosia pacifica]